MVSTWYMYSQYLGAENFVFCQILADTRRTGVAPYEDKFLRFQTTGYSGTLGGMEPLYIVRTGLCNIKGLMNSMPFDQVPTVGL